MKYAMLLLVAPAAYACPDLHGTYECSSRYAPYEFSISQAGRTFQIDDWELIADGKTRPERNDSANQYSAICDLLRLKIQEWGPIENDRGKKIGTFRVITHMSKGQNGELFEEVYGRADLDSGKIYPINSSSSCKRK